MSDESDVADPQPRKQKRTKRAYSDEFEKFWKIYPRTKDGKFPASKAFTKALKVADLDTILTGAQQYRDDPNRVDAYTKMATTWLNQRCWEDGPLPPRGGRVTMMDRLRGEYDTLMPQPEQPQLRQIEGGQQW